MPVDSVATVMAGFLLGAVAPEAPAKDEGKDAASASSSASVSTDGGSSSTVRTGKRSTVRELDAAEKAEEKKKPWYLRWAPERNEIDAGMYFGGFVLARNHGLFDPGQGPQPEVNRGSFAMGFRLSYFPLAFLGVGVEGGFSPTRSPELDTKATLFNFRGHAIGQLPYRLTPTYVIGGGLLGINSSTTRLQSNDAAFHHGPGIKFHINKWIAVRADGRHLVAGNGNNGERQHHGEITAGIEATIRLGRIIRRYRARTDRDGDGIKDGPDRCPDLYGEFEYDGCPTGADTDDDGTPDAEDKCPREWGDLPNGCPSPDADGDGILNKADMCPKESEVYNGIDDTDGCPDSGPVSTVPMTQEEARQAIERLTGVIEGIAFSSGRATIRKSSHSTLDTAVETLKQFPSVEIEVVGHTDSTGKRSSNDKLSEQRAAAVKKYLVRKGIDDKRITTRGAGQSEPVASNKTKDGRAKNRRIEFLITKQ